MTAEIATIATPVNKRYRVTNIVETISETHEGILYEWEENNTYFEYLFKKKGWVRFPMLKNVNMGVVLDRLQEDEEEQQNPSENKETKAARDKALMIKILNDLLEGEPEAQAAFRSLRTNEVSAFISAWQNAGGIDIPLENTHLSND